MKSSVQLRVLPHEAVSQEILIRIAAKNLSVDIKSISQVQIVKRSIDARQRQVFIQLQVLVYIDEVPEPSDIPNIDFPNVQHSPEVIVIGAGPAGLFAALRLIELGLKPIVIERGQMIADRKREIASLNKNKVVNSESNYAFGEGGAGTFSDGKLYTRSHKRGDFTRFLKMLCLHGADQSILVDAHPHVGTEKLPGVIIRIREQILNCGGEIHFNTRIDKLLITNNNIKGAIASDGSVFEAEALILATGHSARDIYHMLNTQNIPLESKIWAMGVRVEHSQHLIDQLQYHSPDGRGEYLPAASYSFATQVNGRGVYSFCMCPGGFMVPAMTHASEMVVNGMSPSKRNSPYANSGIVVEIHPEDIKDFNHHGSLAGLFYQQSVEKNCRLASGADVIAPAQRLGDFVNQSLSKSLPDCSYIPGVTSVEINNVLPSLISEKLRIGFNEFGKKLPGYLTNDAIVLATESRTSSPVRIPRDPMSLQHITINGLYPCGEGAGYAGGIASSALDGERCAEKVFTYLFPSKSIPTIASV